MVINISKHSGRPVSIEGFREHFGYFVIDKIKNTYDKFIGRKRHKTVIYAMTTDEFTHLQSLKPHNKSNAMVRTSTYSIDEFTEAFENNNIQVRSGPDILYDSFRNNTPYQNSSF